jgi:hypothetical protein
VLGIFVKAQAWQECLEPFLSNMQAFRAVREEVSYASELLHMRKAITETVLNDMAGHGRSKYGTLG